MSINLSETVQQNLGYPALQKIDPNTQAVHQDENSGDENKFGQSAIPAVLTAMYTYVQTDEGATDILETDNSADWVNKLFDNNGKEAVDKIAAYSNEPAEAAVYKMNAIAKEAVKVVKAQLTADSTILDVKVILADQKNTTLLYLPAALNMGALLHYGSLDDNTNKMEGPVSSLMQSIGAAFSGPVTEEEIKKQQ